MRPGPSRKSTSVTTSTPSRRTTSLELEQCIPVGGFVENINSKVRAASKKRKRLDSDDNESVNQLQRRLYKLEIERNQAEISKLKLEKIKITCETTLSKLKIKKLQKELLML